MAPYRSDRMKIGLRPATDTAPLLISGAQLRAARSLLRISAEELAARSGVGIATIRRAEGRKGAHGLTRANMMTLRRVLEEAGVEFIFVGTPAPAGGEGVRIKADDEPGLLFDDTQNAAVLLA